MFYNFCIATVSCEVLGGIAMEEMQQYYKERIIEALNSMKSEKYLKMVFFFTKSCYKEEKKKET